MAKPTHEDAVIMLQLAQLEATLHMSDSSSWMWSDEFVTDGGGFIAKYPPGSEGFRKLLMLASHFETMGTLWKNGLLNQTLLFDWMAMPLVWNGQIHGINIAKTGVR